MHPLQPGQLSRSAFLGRIAWFTSIRIDSKFARCFQRGALSLSLSGRVRAGVYVSVQQCIRIDPNFAEAYSNLGNALKELGDVAGAIQFYLKVRYSFIYLYFCLFVCLALRVPMLLWLLWMLSVLSAKIIRFVCCCVSVVCVLMCFCVFFVTIFFFQKFRCNIRTNRTLVPQA